MKPAPMLDRARAYGDAEFIVADQMGGGQMESGRLSFAEFFTKTDALAGWLQQEVGIKSGQHVGIVMQNAPEWMIGFLAIIQSGAVAVLLNSKGTGESMAHAVADGDCIFLLADEKRLARLREAGCDVPALCCGAAFNTALMAGHNAPSPPASTQDDIACLLYTSGTMGRAKPAALTHRNMVTGLMNISLSITQTLTSIAQNYQISVEELKKHMPQAVNLLIFPLFHVSGLLAMFLANLVSGGKLVLLNRWDAHVLLDLIAQEKISMMGGVPSMYWDLLTAIKNNAMKGRETDLSSLRTISCGGQAFPPNLHTALTDALPDVILATGYGMTETSGVVASVSGAAFAHAPMRSGKIFPMLDVRIVDDAGEEASPHNSGEICLRGPLIMQGYYKQAANDAKTLRDGWLYTGDIGYMDEEGYLYVVGR